MQINWSSNSEGKPLFRTCYAKFALNMCEIQSTCAKMYNLCANCGWFSHSVSASKLIFESEGKHENVEFRVEIYLLKLLRWWFWFHYDGMQGMMKMMIVNRAILYQNSKEMNFGGHDNGRWWWKMIIEEDDEIWKKQGCWKWWKWWSMKMMEGKWEKQIGKEGFFNFFF